MDYSVGDATYIDLKSTAGTSYDTVAEVEELSAGDLAKLSFYILYNNTGKIASAVYIVDNTPLATTAGASAIESALATAGVATISGGAVSLTEALDVPEGATLYVTGGDLSSTGDITVEGAIVMADGYDVSGGNVTVSGTNASITATDVTATTKITTGDGAVINATNMTAPTIDVGCEVTVDVLTATAVNIKGDDATSRLTVNDTVTATGSDIAINLLGDSAQLVFAKNTTDITSSDTLTINVGASGSVAATNAYIDFGGNTAFTGTAVFGHIYGTSDVTVTNMPSGTAIAALTGDIVDAGAKLTLAGNNKVTLTSLGEKLDLVLAADSVTTLGGASAVRNVSVASGATAVVAGGSSYALTVNGTLTIPADATMKFRSSTNLTFGSSATISIAEGGKLNVAGTVTTVTHAQTAALGNKVAMNNLTLNTAADSGATSLAYQEFTAEQPNITFYKGVLSGYGEMTCGESNTAAEAIYRLDFSSNSSLFPNSTFRGVGNNVKATAKTNVASANWAVTSGFAAASDPWVVIVKDGVSAASYSAGEIDPASTHTSGNTWVTTGVYRYVVTFPQVSSPYNGS